MQNSFMGVFQFSSHEMGMPDNQLEMVLLYHWMFSSLGTERSHEASSHYYFGKRSDVLRLELVSLSCVRRKHARLLWALGPALPFAGGFS